MAPNFIVGAYFHCWRLLSLFEPTFTVGAYFDFWHIFSLVASLSLLAPTSTGGAYFHSWRLLSLVAPTFTRGAYFFGGAYFHCCGEAGAISESRRHQRTAACRRAKVGRESIQLGEPLQGRREYCRSPPGPVLADDRRS